MDINSTSTPFRIGFLLIDGFALMSYSCAVEPLRAANLLASEVYTMEHISINGGHAVASSGAMVSTTALSMHTGALDMVLVVAGGDPFSITDKHLMQWLRNHARAGTMIGGVSGGPVVLANAGVIHGRRMTLHWEHAEPLAAVAQDLLIERSLYVIDRDRLTCAGGTAPLDMMHALITRHHGASFATRVSDWFLHTTIRLASEPQRAGLATRYQTHNPAILTVIEIMENHVADPLALSQLANIAGLGVRQLNRLFRDKLGASTIGFYRQLRINVARNLLEQSGLSVTEIALATGFTSTAHFSTTFRKLTGIAPSGCRIHNTKTPPIRH